MRPPSRVFLPIDPQIVLLRMQFLYRLYGSYSVPPPALPLPAPAEGCAGHFLSPLRTAHVFLAPERLPQSTKFTTLLRPELVYNTFFRLFLSSKRMVKSSYVPSLFQTSPIACAEVRINPHVCALMALMHHSFPPLYRSNDTYLSPPSPTVLSDCSFVLAGPAIHHAPPFPLFPRLPPEQR